MVTGFTFLSRLTQIAPPHTRFVFLGAGIRLGLPSHPASRRRSCLRLGVSITSSSRGLSPPSDRPCRAYSRRRRCAPPRPAALGSGCGLGRPTRPGAPGNSAHDPMIRQASRQHHGAGSELSSSACQCPSRGHRVKGACSVARDRYATLDPPTAHQGLGAYQEDGGRAGGSSGGGHRRQRIKLARSAPTRDMAGLKSARQIPGRQHYSLVNAAGKKISIRSARVLLRSCTRASCDAA